MDAEAAPEARTGKDSANCVELAADSVGTTHLRESDDPEVVIATTPATLRAFLRAAKAGEFDRLGG
ncbi:DUF397 domain-containing protein [Streptomyces sp. RCU064]|uniref:DUF397 domain-containing protein n=1 Tax=Streptomyces rugosispiralis TaxID=2967341 RepID=A0ABT1V4X2_9ACTN|nr:DUF397 domain-containing protein [Streptomyces rugosispiralis]